MLAQISVDYQDIFVSAITSKMALIIIFYKHQSVKIDNKQILTFALIIILVCFITVFVFTLPSFFKQFNLSTDATGNIGSAVGGITAPFIGIISSILLYLALTRQTQSNVDQRIKNESDIIFLLLNQLDNEISSFYFSFTQSKGDEKHEFSYSGIQAFNIFIQQLNTGSMLSNFEFTFNSFYQAKQILLVIKSFVLIEKRIELAEISPEIKEMFKQKIEAVYQCKFQESLKILLGTIDKYPRVKDNVTDEIDTFFKVHNKGTIANSGFAPAEGNE